MRRNPKPKFKKIDERSTFGYIASDMLFRQVNKEEDICVKSSKLLECAVKPGNKEKIKSCAREKYRNFLNYFCP